MIVTCQEGNRSFDFSLDKNALSKCIEDHFLNSKDSFFKETEFAKSLADLTANRFSGKTETVKGLNSKLKVFFHDLRRPKSQPFGNQQFYTPLRLLIKEALIICEKNLSVQLSPAIPFSQTNDMK